MMHFSFSVNWNQQWSWFRLKSTYGLIHTSVLNSCLETSQFFIFLETAHCVFPSWKNKLSAVLYECKYPDVKKYETKAFDKNKYRGIPGGTICLFKCVRTEHEANCDLVYSIDFVHCSAATNRE